jgi:hypothetical protein
MTLGLGYVVKFAYENNFGLDADLLKYLSKVFVKKNVKV